MALYSVVAPDYLLANWFIFLVILRQTKAISPAWWPRVSHLFCSCSFEYCFWPNMIKKCNRMIKSLFKKGFSVKDRGLKGISRCIRRVDLISGWGNSLFKLAKVVSRSARSHSWLCPFKTSLLNIYLGSLASSSHERFRKRLVKFTVFCLYKSLPENRLHKNP